MSKIKTFDTFSTYYYLFKSANISRRFLLFSVVFISIASVFQMLGLGLVVPVLNALVDESSFRGITTAPILGDFIRILPIEQNSTNIIILMMLLIFMAVVLENFSVLIGRFYSLKIEKELSENLRNRLFKKYLSFHRGYFAKTSNADLNTLITHFVPAACRTNSNITLLFLQSMFAIIFLALMLTISVQLSMLALVLLPFIHFLAKHFLKKIKFSAVRAHVDLKELSRQVDDVYRNIPLVQLAVRELAEIKIFSKLSRSVSKHTFNARFRSYFIPALVDIVNAAGALLIVTVGIFIFTNFQHYSLGRLLVFFVSLRRFVSNVQQCINCWAQIYVEQPALEQIESALKLEDDININSGDLFFSGIDNEITFNKVSFSYETDKPVLSDISFAVKKNEVVAVVGPSGAGKTTLLNLLPRFYNLNQGQIAFDGVDYTNFTLESLRKKIAIVSQDTQLFNQSIRYNLTYGLDNYSETDLQTAISNAQLGDLVNKLEQGIDTVVGSQGKLLSGGEIQRLSIARAILADPVILILDEPTSALDAVTEKRLDQALSSVLSQRTVFIIAHRITTITNADKIIFLDNGQIQEIGNYQDLISMRGKFYEFSQLQGLL